MVQQITEHPAYGIARELSGCGFKRITRPERELFFERKGTTLGNVYQQLTGYVPTEKYVPEGSNPNALGISIGVDKEVPFFFGLLKLKERERFYVATIWFEKELDAIRDRKWVLETYGREHTEGIIKVVENYAKKENVDLEVVISGNAPLPEVDLSAFRGVD